MSNTCGNCKHSSPCGYGEIECYHEKRIVKIGVWDYPITRPHYNLCGLFEQDKELGSWRSKRIDMRDFMMRTTKWWYEKNGAEIPGWKVDELNDAYRH